MEELFQREDFVAQNLQKSLTGMNYCSTDGKLNKYNRTDLVRCPHMCVSSQDSYCLSVTAVALNQCYKYMHI